MQLLTIYAILFTIGGVMFTLQNDVPVMVSFALWQFDGSLAQMLLISLALGALIAALVPFRTPGYGPVPPLPCKRFSPRPRTRRKSALVGRRPSWQITLSDHTPVNCISALPVLPW